MALPRTGVIHTFWIASQNDPPLLGQRVQDLQLLVIILLALTGLYTLVFLLAPSMSDRILRKQGEQTVTALRNQLSSSAGELWELRDEIRQIVLGQAKTMQERRPEIVQAAWPAAAWPALDTAAWDTASQGAGVLLTPGINY